MLRSDDPWVKEPMQVTEDLSYILNEIKAQEDTARQLTSVCALLIGVYTAMVINNQSKVPLKFVIGTPNVILFLPIVFWFFTIIAFILLLTLRDTNKSLESKKSCIIKKIQKTKRIFLVVGSVFFLIGIVSVLIIAYAVLSSQLNPDLIWTKNGDILFSAGDYNESAVAFKKALETDPYNSMIHNRYGLALYEAKRYDEADLAFAMARTLDPDNVQYLINRGNAFYHLKDYDRALQAYGMALEMDKDQNNTSIQMLINLTTLTLDGYGHFLYNHSKYDEAIKAYDKIIQINPRNADVCANAWNMKGNIFFALSNYPEAINAFINATEINPQLAKAWCNKAIALNKDSRRSDAKVALDKAKDLGYIGCCL